MRRIQLIALLLVVIMAVATIPAIAATEVKSAPAPVVGAYRTPTLSAICVPTYPSRYQTYTVYGWLKWSGTPLPYKYVKVYYRFSSQSTWHYLKSVQTNVNGRYSFSSSTGAQYVYWMMKFAGDSVYYPKTTYLAVHIGAHCNHVDVIVYFPYNSPCSMCIMRKVYLEDFAKLHKPYVTVTTRTIPSGDPLLRAKCSVRETGQVYYGYTDTSGNPNTIIAWVSGHLGC